MKLVGKQGTGLKEPIIPCQGVCHCLDGHYKLGGAGGGMHQICILQRSKVQDIFTMGDLKQEPRPPQDKHLMYCLIKEPCARFFFHFPTPPWEGLPTTVERYSFFCHPGLWEEESVNHQDKNFFFWNLRLQREVEFLEEIQKAFFPE